MRSLRSLPLSDLPHLLLVLATLALAVALAVRPPEPADPVPAASPADATAIQLEAIGLATLSWITDQVGAQLPAAAKGAPAATCVARTAVDIGTIPLISHAALEALLVPGYIAALPTNDAFGHPFEFRLDTTLLGAQLVAVRSPGADGTFEGTAYSGGFTGGPAEDQVWSDGFFVRARPLLDPISLQERAVGELLAVGAAAFSWLVDQISDPQVAIERGPVLRGPVYDLGLIDAIDHATMVSRLVPGYTLCVPELDPWGRPYDYYFDDNLLAAQVVAIRTAGADGVTEGDAYPIGGFPADELASDIVWGDGVFVRFPDGPRSDVFADDFETGDVWGTWSCTEP